MSPEVYDGFLQKRAELAGVQSFCPAGSGRIDRDDHAWSPRSNAFHTHQMAPVGCGTVGDPPGCQETRGRTPPADR